MKAGRWRVKLTYGPAAATESMRPPEPVSGSMRAAISAAICAGLRRSCFARAKQGRA